LVYLLHELDRFRMWGEPNVLNGEPVENIVEKLIGLAPLLERQTLGLL